MSNRLVIPMLLLISLHLNPHALANEGGAKAPETAKEGEGGGVQGLRSTEYNAKVSEINKIEAKIKDQRLALHELLRVKMKTKDKAALASAIDEIKILHEDLNKNIKRFNEASRELKYRFPDEGYLTERRYIQLQEKSVQEIEEELGLSTDLKKLKAKVDKKYKPFAPPPEEQKKVAPKINSDVKKEAPEEAEPKLRLVK